MVRQHWSGGGWVLGLVSGVDIILAVAIGSFVGLDILGCVLRWLVLVFLCEGALCR